MEFRILGSLEVSEEDRPLDLGGPKQRALLAILLLNANRVVSRDRLIDALWEEQPPETAPKALQVYVSQLRKTLGAGRIVTRPPGYLIRVEPGELDLERFERLLESGGTEKLREALALWRGRPLEEFALDRFAQSEISRLDELRLAALEERIEADLAFGRHAALVAELEAFVAEHPLRERLCGQLMLALYRSGRQAEALAAYQDARRALVDELGIEPSRALQDLERAILQQDPGLDLAPAPEPAAESEPAEPPSLPPIPEERKVVTVLFADLAGFTGRAEILDPEDARELLGRWYGCVRAEVERFGGLVDKFIGDAVMSLFGAPVARGDDPERAVRAAFAVREAVQRLNEEEPGLDLRFRVGVNTGEALVAPEARLREGEGMVVGDVVNTASRLQALAPVGGILVGEETYRATRSAIRYEQVRSLKARGKREPVRAWAALDAAPPVEQRPGSARFVGRSHELGLLRDVWRRVVDERRPHLVTVTAPPGVGKTRLAAELVRLVEAEGGRAVVGRALPYAESAGQSPFARQTKRLAGIFESDPLPLACEKLEQTVAVLLGPEQVEEVASPLASLIGLAPPETSADKQVAFYAARRFAEGLAFERPTVLVCEDIQWADGGQLDLLAYLASRVRDVPLLLLALARPELIEARPSWGAGLAAHTGLVLEPLGPAESRELAAGLLEAAEPGLRGLAERLAERAEGNPLFLEELAASVIEGAAASPDELPTTVRAIIAARLDGLSAAERAVLLDASVLGKVFWRGALMRLGGPEERLSEILDSLEGRDLVRRQPSSRLEGDQEFLFKHMLIRDVAYATLPRAARRERHAAAAAFLEEAAGDRVGEWASVLAHHWREAGEPEQELRYLLLAAEHAWPSEGVSLYDRALELIPEDEPERRRAPRLRRALARVQASQFVEAIGDLDALLPELEGRERFEAVRARARAAFWVGDVAGARAFAEEAKALADELGDKQLEALTIAFFSTLRSSVGEVAEAAELNERAVAMWKPGSHRRELADTLGWLSLQNYWLGRYEPALERALHAQELGRETSSEEMVSGVSNVGLALAGLGRHEEALTEFAEGAALGRELELAPRWTARLLNMWAGTLREVGDLEGARRLNEEAVELASSAEFPGAIASGKIDLLFSDLATGEVGRAAFAWPELWQTAVQTRGWHEWLWRVRLAEVKAEIEFAQGKAEEAAAAALAAVALAESFGRVKYALASRLVLGSALLQLKRHEEAVGPFRRALAEAEALEHPPSIIRAAGRLREALAATGDDDGAEAAYRRAREALDAFAAGLSDARRERFLQTPVAADVLVLAPAR